MLFCGQERTCSCLSLCTCPRDESVPVLSGELNQGFALLHRNDWFKFYELLLAVPSCERLCQIIIKAVQAEMNFTEWLSLHLNWTFFRHILFALSSVFLVATIFCGNCLRANVSAPRRARVHSEFIIIWSVVYTSTIHHL